MFGKSSKIIPPQLARVTVAQLLDQPEIRKIGDRLAAESLEHRRALAAQLTEVSGEKADARCAGAWRKHAQLEGTVAAARAALEAAIAKRGDAHAELAALCSSIELQRCKLERELIESADPRLERFATWLEDVFFAARSHVVVEFEPPPPGPTAKETREQLSRALEAATAQEKKHFSISGYLPSLSKKHADAAKLRSNAVEIENIMTASRRLGPEVRQAMLEALDADQVSACLEKWRESLRASMSRAGMGFDDMNAAAA